MPIRVLYLPSNRYGTHPQPLSVTVAHIGLVLYYKYYFLQTHIAFTLEKCEFGNKLTALKMFSSVAVGYLVHKNVIIIIVDK